MKANPATPPDPSTMVLGIARFAEAAVAYSEHRAEIAARRGRGELGLSVTFDLSRKRIVIDAIGRDGRRAAVLALTFRDRRGWMAE